MQQRPVELLTEEFSELCIDQDDTFEEMLSKVLLMTDAERDSAWQSATRILDVIEIADDQLKSSTPH